MTIFEQLKKEAEYARRSLSYPLLHKVHGAFNMAYQLGAITKEEYYELNTMVVVFMNTDREFHKHGYVV